MLVVLLARIILCLTVTSNVYCVFTGSSVGSYDD